MNDVILVDCDGVLGDFCGAFLNVFNTRHGTTCTPSDITEFDIVNVIPELTSDEFWAICNEEGFCRSIKPMPGAVDAIHRLRSTDHDVVCLTAPMKGPFWVSERYEWLIEHFDFEFKDIVIASRKELIDGAALIDDRLSNLKAWAETHVGGVPIVFNAPYNMDADLVDHPSNGWHRYDTWLQITDVLIGSRRADESSSFVVDK